MRPPVNERTITVKLLLLPIVFFFTFYVSTLPAGKLYHLTDVFMSWLTHVLSSGDAYDFAHEHNIKIITAIPYSPAAGMVNHRQHPLAYFSPSNIQLTDSATYFPANKEIPASTTSDRSGLAAKLPGNSSPAEITVLAGLAAGSSADERLSLARQSPELAEWWAKANEGVTGHTLASLTEAYQQDAFGEK